MRPGATLLAVLAAAPVSLAAAELPEHERTLRGRVVAGVAAGKRSRVYVDIAGRTTRAVVVAASAEEITVRPSGVTMQLRWEQIGPARRLGIYAKYVDEKQAADWLALARYALSAGENEAACEYLEMPLKLGLAPNEDATKLRRELQGPRGPRVLPRKSIQAPAVSGKGSLAPGGDRFPIPLHAPVERRVLEINLDGPPGAGRLRHPVAGSVPIPRGELRDPSRVKLVDSGAKEIPCQTRALAFWPEGSVKWLNMVFLARPGRRAGMRYTLEYGTGVRPGPALRFVYVTGGGQRVSIVTGPAEFALRAGGPHLISRASLHGRSIIGGPVGGARGLYLDLGPVGSSGAAKRLQVRVKKLTVEEGGPVRAVIRADAEAVGGTRPIPITVRAHAYADSTTLELRHTFVFTCEPKSESIAAMGYELPVAFTPRRLSLADESGKVLSCGVAEGLSALQAKHDAYSVSGGLSRKGRRLAGWLGISDDLETDGLMVAVRDLHRLFPKALAVAPGGRRLDVSLWPREAGPLVFGRKPGQTDEGFYRNSEMIGVAKSHGILIHLHEGRPHDARAAEAAAAFDRPAFPFVSTKWNAESRALGFVGVQGAGASAAAERGAEALWDFLFFHQHNEPWYGAMDYGDMQDVYESREDTWRYLRGRWGWHGQMFHDLAMLTQYLRTGKRKYLDSGLALSRHMSDVDTVHFVRPGHSKWTDKVGSVHRHNAQHWVDVGEAKYTRPQGWLLAYYLTGDRRIWDVIEKEATPYLISERSKGLLGTYGGQVNWGLMGMWEATGDAKYREMAKEFCYALIARQGADGSFEGLAENEYYFFNTGWVASLVEYHNLTGDEKVGRAILRLAERRLKGPWGQTWAGHVEGTRLYASAWRQTGDAKYLEAIRSGLRTSFGAIPEPPAAKTRQSVKHAAAATGQPYLWKFDIVMTDLLQLPYGVGALQGAGRR